LGLATRDRTGRLVTTGSAAGTGISGTAGVASTCGVSDAIAGSSFFVDRLLLVFVDGRPVDVRIAGFFSSGI
jgi:hypothetical protein